MFVNKSKASCKVSSTLSCPSLETVAIATKTKNPLFLGNVRGNHENKNCVCLYIHCVLDYHTHYTKKVDFFVLVAMATVSGLGQDSALSCYMQFPE